ncbi:hypothetical protein SHKM778_27710 [Streptomyces sp. KM77-8]|uniref:Uncharacterized protein n=1 Tax=Streptomyces haneummycinicus TaxID=3074435 RepID=A0AAT9HFX0_9ACTN
MVAPGGSHRTGGDSGDHRRVHAQCHTAGAELLAQPLLPVVGVRGDARGHVHLGGPAPGGDRAHLTDDRPLPDQEPAAEAAQ